MARSVCFPTPLARHHSARVLAAPIYEEQHLFRSEGLGGKGCWLSFAIPVDAIGDADTRFRPRIHLLSPVQRGASPVTGICGDAAWVINRGGRATALLPEGVALLCG